MINKSMCSSDVILIFTTVDTLCTGNISLFVYFVNLHLLVSKDKLRVKCQFHFHLSEPDIFPHPRLKQIHMFSSHMLASA